jgi:hypothetical protein
MDKLKFVNTLRVAIFSLAWGLGQTFEVPYKFFPKVNILQPTVFLFLKPPRNHWGTRMRGIVAGEFHDQGDNVEKHYYQ